AVGPEAVAPGDLPAILRGVHLDLAPIALDAGPHVREAANELFTLLDREPPAEPAKVRAALGASPLTDLFISGSETLDAAGASALASAARDRPGDIRAITVDGTAFHHRGASDAQELGAAVAAGVEHVRDLTDAGMGTADAL